MTEQLLDSVNNVDHFKSKERIHSFSSNLKFSCKGINELSNIDGVLESILSQASTGVEELSKHEIEVMILIVAGRSNKQIAKLLCRSQRTVEYHRNRLMAKLNVHNTVDLVKCAIAMGLV